MKQYQSSPEVLRVAIERGLQDIPLIAMLRPDAITLIASITVENCAKGINHAFPSHNEPTVFWAIVRGLQASPLFCVFQQVHLEAIGEACLRYLPEAAQ